jgi:hypothetical protein
MSIRAQLYRAMTVLFVVGTATTTNVASAQVLGPPNSNLSPSQMPVAPSLQVAQFNPSPILAELAVRPASEVVRKKHHLEMDATMADGRRVIVSFDLSGRLWEVEHADHDKHRFGDGPINPNSALESVRDAGFASTSVREVKRNHTVISAATRKNERVELHVDRSGTIYKQVWLR